MVARDMLEAGKTIQLFRLRKRVRMMKVMDDIRKQGGVAYPQDK
jgi:dihydrodiol dehydrogenase / D-xylose 1-dehydrogenase (NADP)